MSQAQREVQIEYLNGNKGSAVATGNNAAWFCHCNRQMPLIGRTGKLSNPTPKTIVTCPDCGSSYFVEPEGGNYKRVFGVRELD